MKKLEFLFFWDFKKNMDINELKAEHKALLIQYAKLLLYYREYEENSQYIIAKLEHEVKELKKKRTCMCCETRSSERSMCKICEDKIHSKD